MGKINLQHVYHTGANSKYFLNVLSLLSKHSIDVKKQRIDDFVNDGFMFGTEGTDVLTYQTFPDENHKKFNPNMVYEADKLFYGFDGLKILVCSHDCGDIDSFSRIPDTHSLPRVKCFPTDKFLGEFNVILLSTVSSNESVYKDEVDRGKRISCNFGIKNKYFYHHRIRDMVKESLIQYFPNKVDFNWVYGKEKYVKSLTKYLIVIGAPGWGRYNGSYSGALRAGALLFAHRSLNDIKFLPHADLIDGEDFVSYDLFNFNMKLKWLLDNPKEAEHIRKNGRKKWKAGFNYSKSAVQFSNYLKKELL